MRPKGHTRTRVRLITGGVSTAPGPAGGRPAAGGTGGPAPGVADPPGGHIRTVPRYLWSDGLRLSGVRPGELAGWAQSTAGEWRGPVDVDPRTGSGRGRLVVRQLLPARAIAAAGVTNDPGRGTGDPVVHRLCTAARPLGRSGTGSGRPRCGHRPRRRWWGRRWWRDAGPGGEPRRVAPSPPSDRAAGIGRRPDPWPRGAARPGPARRTAEPRYQRERGPGLTTPSSRASSPRSP